MASVGAGAPKVPQSKARSRRDGAAIPLDEADKRLMNLLQSSFPLDAEPFALLASEAEMELDDVLARTQRLLDGRIIREITPIFDTRALGYESPPRSTPRTRSARRRSSTPTRASRTTTCARTTSTSGSRSRPRRTRSSGCRARSTCSSG